MTTQELIRMVDEVLAQDTPVVVTPTPTHVSEVRFAFHPTATTWSDIHITR